MIAAQLGRVHRTFFAKTLSNASSSTSDVEGASSSLSSCFLLEGGQSRLEVARASLDGFTNVGKALALETLPKARSVDCLLIVAMIMRATTVEAPCFRTRIRKVL